MQAILWILAVALATSAHAADRDELAIIGFSKSGQYLAYELHGIADGSGQSYSVIRIMDVPANRWVGDRVSYETPEKVLETKNQPSHADVRAKARSLAQPQIKKFDIDTNNAGEHLVARLLSDLSGETNRVKFAVDYFPENMHGGQVYDLRLVQRPARTKECDSFDLKSTKIFSLTLTPESPEGKPIILQADKTIPKSRNCPLNYSIAHVYRSGKMLVVFIRFTSGPGFEGSNISYLAVGGKLP